MTNTRTLVGSLSNDLLRAATLKQRGSHPAAKRFLQEAKRWAKPLHQQAEKKYIKKIAHEILTADTDRFSEKEAELYLMYSILLQNHALHLP